MSSQGNCVFKGFGQMKKIEIKNKKRAAKRTLAVPGIANGAIVKVSAILRMKGNRKTGT